MCVPRLHIDNDNVTLRVRLYWAESVEFPYLFHGRVAPTGHLTGILLNTGGGTRYTSRVRLILYIITFRSASKSRVRTALLSTIGLLSDRSAVFGVSRRVNFSHALYAKSTWNLFYAPDRSLTNKHEFRIDSNVQQSRRRRDAGILCR